MEPRYTKSSNHQRPDVEVLSDDQARRSMHNNTYGTPQFQPFDPSRSAKVLKGVIFKYLFLPALLLTGFIALVFTLFLLAIFR